MSEPVKEMMIDEDEIDLSELVGFLFNARKLIAIVAVVFTIIAVVYALLATPIYRSDVLIQVEEKSSGALDELSSLMSEKSPTETEIQILKSRAVIGATVDQLRLDIVASPVYFPLLGKTIARHHTDGTVASPLLGMNSYAWGGEQIQVDRLDVSRNLVEQKLVLVSGKEHHFTLLGPDDETLLTGEVGKAAEGHGTSIFISRLDANPGTRFYLIKRNRLEEIGKLNRALSIGEQGRKTGIISMSMEYQDPEQLSNILSSIANNYVRQNVERRSQEAEQTLKFLDTQLPELKSSLDTAETQLAQYRSQVGTVDLTMEAQGMLDQYADLEKRVSELELKRTELGEKFTSSHPAIVALNEQIGKLRGSIKSLDEQIRALPEQEQKSLRMSRDVKVNNELYLLLLNKAQEMRVVKAGTTGNVRIIDQAYVPVKPVKPRRLLIVVAGILLGIMAGIFAAFLRKALNKGISDPDMLEKRLGISSYASIMHSDKEASFRRANRKGDRTTEHVLAFAQPDDLAIEALRSLRTSLQFASLDAPNNIIAITGPAPDIGKSFVTSNLAAVLAESGKRVLLIDADMRKGQLHSEFGLERTTGLSNLISGEVDAANTIIAIRENLYLLPRGIVPPNPSELLMSEQFAQLLSSFSGQYDIVIVDTPPVLAVTDASIIGRLAGINFVVLRSGYHPMREIELTLMRLRQSGVHVNGFVFNDVPVKSTGYGNNYNYHYHYHYK